MDFVGDFTDNPSQENLAAAFTTVIELGEESEYIEADEASVALAAAELLAAKLAKPAPDFPQGLHPALLLIQPTIPLQTLARKAVKQVMKESELQELWAEGDDLAAWLAIQKDLLNRLK